MFVFIPQVINTRIKIIILGRLVFASMKERVNAKFQDLFYIPPNPKH
jgi:hypothetical protein